MKSPLSFVVMEIALATAIVVLSVFLLLPMLKNIAEKICAGVP